MFLWYKVLQDSPDLKPTYDRILIFTFANFRPRVTGEPKVDEIAADEKE
jgi:hypothetical protein